jgi:energy-coupling factor transporter transmembrane protein EcfT
MQLESTATTTEHSLGSLGRLVIFLWALLMVLLPPLEKGTIPALIALGGLSALYPSALRRLIQPRWLLILLSLFLVNVFFGAGQTEKDLPILGMTFSSAAVFNGIQMVLRAAVILLDADGLSASVDITQVAGLIERGGLRGLGFSIGVAVNLLPDLRQSSLNAWHSLKMRGGLRARWGRGLQLLVLTVLTNALRHSEEIVLAAEARAFRPELSRTAPLQRGTLDLWVVTICAASLLLTLLAVWG